MWKSLTMFFKTKIKQLLDGNRRKSFTKDYAKFLNNTIDYKKKAGIIYDAGLQIYMRKPPATSWQSEYLLYMVFDPILFPTCFSLHNYHIISLVPAAVRRYRIISIFPG